MKIFTDNAGRTWTISVNVDAIKRVRDLLKEDLLNIEQVFPRLLVDPILLCDVIYCICKPQADAEHVSEADFGRAMSGEVIGHAKTALIEELVNFFHDPLDRENLDLAIKAFNQMAARAREAVKLQLQGPAMEKAINIMLSEIGKSFTNSPELSESTPDR